MLKRYAGLNELKYLILTIAWHFNPSHYPRTLALVLVLAIGLALEFEEFLHVEGTVSSIIDFSVFRQIKGQTDTGRIREWGGEWRGGGLGRAYDIIETYVSCIKESVCTRQRRYDHVKSYQNNHAFFHSFTN